MTQEIAHREQASPPAPTSTMLAKLTEVSGIPERVVSVALATRFKNVAPEYVAIALTWCGKYNWNPLGNCIEIIQGRRGPLPFITAEGRVAIAQQRPDFQGFEFEEREEGDLLYVECRSYRAGWRFPALGGASEKRSDKDAREKARSKALRNSLKRLFGEQLAEPGEFPETERPMRPDQRRALFYGAKELGWDDQQRHQWSTDVLGRPCSSWRLDADDAPNEEEAAQLVSEMESLVARMQVSQAPEVQRAHSSPHPVNEPARTSSAKDEDASVTGEGTDSPSPEPSPPAAREPKTPAAAGADARSPAPAAAPARSASPKVMAELTAIATELGWDAPVPEDADAAQKTLRDWRAVQRSTRDDLRRDFLARCAAVQLDPTDFLPAGRALGDLTARELQALIDELVESSPSNRPNWPAVPPQPDLGWGEQG